MAPAMDLIRNLPRRGIVPEDLIQKLLLDDPPNTNLQAFLRGLEHARRDNRLRSSRTLFETCYNAARQGDAVAQISLAILYASGQDAPQSNTEALRWLREVAQKKAVRAQFNLGLIHSTKEDDRSHSAASSILFRLAVDNRDFDVQHSLGIVDLEGPEDDDEVHSYIEHLKRESNAGNVNAQYDLAALHETGWGVSKDPEISAHLYRKAASSGHVRAQINLAFSLATGLGIQKNENEAMVWIESASRHDPKIELLRQLFLRFGGHDVGIKDEEEANRIFLFLQSEGLFRSFITLYDPSLNHRLNCSVPNTVQVAKRYSLAASQGEPFAQVQLAHLYATGVGVPQDHSRAAGWYERAARRGSPIACFRLAVMYESGKGVKQSPSVAAKWYFHAAKLGHQVSMFNLSFLYCMGEGVVRNDRKAIDWLTKVGIDGISRSIFDVGQQYEYGQGLSQDHSQALELYHLAASMGCVHAQSRLGTKYFLGHGVDQDLTQAVEWYALADRNGCSIAAQNLELAFEECCGIPNWMSYAIRWDPHRLRSMQPGGPFRTSNIELYWMGRLYERGLVVHQDYEYAVKFLYLALKNGNDLALDRLKWLCESGRLDGIKLKKDYTWMDKRLSSNLRVGLGAGAVLEETLLDLIDAPAAESESSRSASRRPM